MTDSIRLCCVLYTLEGKSVQDNKYVDIFLVWLSHVSKYAELRPIDCVQIAIDERTKNYLVEHNQIWNRIRQTLECELQFQIIPSPKTHAEGMMNKYIYKPYPQDVYMYCDIDILIKQPIQLLLDGIEDNTIVVHCEGTLADPNYGAACIEEDISNKHDIRGFSAGKFIIVGQTLCESFFQRVHILAKSHPIDTYYCVEQPIFNLAVYQFESEQVCTINTDRICNPFICANILGSGSDQTVLIDYMGEPGNDVLHFSKIFHILIDYFLNHTHNKE